jgi:outer membrane protein OmpA-like peptidoglycan-associated protein
VAPVAQPTVAPYSVPPAPTAPPKASSGHPILKAVLAVLGILLMLVVVCVAAGRYFYYHSIKPKVAQIESVVRSFPKTEQAPGQPAPPGGDPSSPSGAGSSPGGAPGAAPPPQEDSAAVGQLFQQLAKIAGPNSVVANAAALRSKVLFQFPPLTPGDQSLYKGQIRFQEGMTIIASMSVPGVGDYDDLISITSVSAQGVTSSWSAQAPAHREGVTTPSAATLLRAHMVFTDAQQDLLHATNRMPSFADYYPPFVPGATSILWSRDAFRAMNSGGGVEVTEGLHPTEASPRAAPNEFWSTLRKTTCRLARAEAADGAFPVLLNGQRVTLPAVRCSCTEQNGKYGFEYVLDDEQMPLVLWTSDGQITEINYPPPPKAQQGGGGEAIEEALKKEGHVDVYGIYFDFASDKLRPESGPVLAEIASILRNNPTWKLHVNGHTDNVGGDAYNLDLSNRRAAAVKQALVTRYQIAPDRLTTAGYGAARPIETNTTLEGRARNRRVELQRQ